jgi:hypothetical protein
MYGSQWLDKWRGIPLDEVKRTWAEDLAGFTAEQLGYALSCVKLACKFPPSSVEFAQFARERTREPAHQQYLPAPRGEIPDNVATALEDYAAAHPKSKDYRAWARKIVANPQNYPAISLEFAKEALAAPAD